ncbi:hypothetical protein B0H19DRAFT_1143709 [Mycena capillaripes]|nr:hypothetical protein B0H19DRAFT_1143709 [Mycena capillaripes]
MHRVSYLLFLLGWATVSRAGNFSNSDIHRDIVIIGGGSSGTYTAFRLQEKGLSVALLERNDRLGGHVNTFHVPNTNTTFDYGVAVYHNISVVVDYFAALGVDIVDSDLSGTSAPTFASLNGDAKVTTAIPPNIPWADNTAVSAALEKYVGLYNTQFSFLGDGFNLPDPVPEDILLSWADFMTKHDLDAVSLSAFFINQGVGNGMLLPALYAMKYFSSLSAGGLSGAGPQFVTTSDSNNQGIYDKALERLGEGEGAFLNTTITHITRGKDGVAVVMKTPKGGKKTVRAKQIVLAIPPIVADLKAIGLQLSVEEENLFNQASYRWYFDAVIQNSGLPDDIDLTNVDFMKLDGIPTAHQMVLSVGGTGVPGLHSLYYSSDRFISDANAKADILATLARFRAANGYNMSVKTGFAAFNNHAPFELTVPVDAIRNGYYKKRDQLQGRQNTWYTGAAWQAHDSTLIWNFTESVVVPGVFDVLCSDGRCS